MKDKEYEKELNELGRLGKMVFEYSGETAKCPTCKNELLRAWYDPADEKETVALCYECGTVFACNSGEIIYRCGEAGTPSEGKESVWGAVAMAVIGLRKDVKEKEKKETDGRLN